MIMMNANPGQQKTPKFGQFDAGLRKVSVLRKATPFRTYDLVTTYNRRNMTEASKTRLSAVLNGYNCTNTVKFDSDLWPYLDFVYTGFFQPAAQYIVSLEPPPEAQSYAFAGLNVE